MSTQLPYRLEINNRLAIVTLLPELNEVPWADIEKVGSEILSRIQNLNSPQLLVDLCPLNYMGSAQVALVVRMFKTVKEKNGKMVVANRDPMVLEVLSLAGLNKVWTIVDSRERALSMLGGGSLMGGSSSSAAASAEGNPMPGMVALVAALIAAIFAVIHLANPNLIPSRGDIFGGLAAAAVAFLAGLWAMNGGNRNIGIGVIVASMAILLYGVFELARPASAPAATPQDVQEPDASKTSAPADAAAAPATQEPTLPEAAAPAAGTPPAAVPPAAVPPAAVPPAAAPPAGAPPAATPNLKTPLVPPNDE
jgi:anti-anti-sigma factor